jgi:acyl-CoA thioesterase I
MKIIRFLCFLLFLTVLSQPGFVWAQIVNQQFYLLEIKTELKKEWPENRTINLVFHGHSVPAGYFKTPKVNTMESYPQLTLKKIKELFPFAVVNSITTAIGGENSVQGSKRFKSSIMNHKPDVLFIDYALNDRRIGLEQSYKSWEKMIKTALKKNVKVILLTPTPDLREDILNDDVPLAAHSEQIRMLAEKYEIGLVDSYDLFKGLAKTKGIEKYMAQNNHINELGHTLIASEIVKWFEP